MEKWQKITSKITLMAVLMLSCFPVIFAQNKKYNPFYYPELIEYADSNKIDFSSEYRKWLMPDISERFEDITLELLDSSYVFERSLHCCPEKIHPNSYC